MPRQFWQAFPTVFWLAKLHLGFAVLIYLFSKLGEVEKFVTVENLANFEELEKYLKEELDSLT